MKSSARNVKLASVDDLFSTEESRADADREKVMEIPLSELHPFKDHPFKVKDDEAMFTADRPSTASASSAPTSTSSMSGLRKIRKQVSQTRKPGFRRCRANH